VPKPNSQEEPAKVEEGGLGAGLGQARTQAASSLPQESSGELTAEITPLEMARMSEQGEDRRWCCTRRSLAEKRRRGAYGVS
jgi:hypothetical protein